MAFHKSTELNTIQKFIQSGKIDKAIKKLDEIINVDPNDASLHLKLGELFLKKSRLVDAKAAYFSAADIYLKDGYNNRAIATYKMISRADPTDLEICIKIAELFEKQGLIGDALQQYKYAATIYDQQGKFAEMSEILHKILELDPDNTPAKIKIAEAHFSNNENDSAYTVLAEISHTLQQKKQYAECVQAFEFFLEKHPKNKFLLKEVAHAHILSGNPDEGLKRIKEAQKLDPEDINTMLVLGETYYMVDKDNDAESIFCDVLRKDEKNYRAKFYLGMIFLKRDNIEEAMNAVAPFYHDFEENGELLELADYYESILEKAPNTMKALEALGEIYRYKNISNKLIGSYMRLADVHHSDSNEEKATALYQRIIQLDPSNDKALRYLSKSSGQVSIEDLTREGESLDDDAIEEHITEANVYLKYGLYDQAKEHIDPILSTDPQNVKALIVLKDIHIGQNANELASSDLFLLSELDAENKDKYMNEVLKLDPENANAKAKLSAPAEAPPTEDKGKETETFEGIDLVIEEPEELKAADKAAETPAKSVQAELEEAEFYFVEGLYEDAKDIYRRVLLNDPYNMTAVDRLEEIEHSLGGTESKETTEPLGPDDALFDFSKELEDSLPEDLLSVDGAKGTETGALDAKDSTDDIFSKFKKGIEQHIDSKDYDSHYNLGIAYKEMGLLNDSIDEFQKALIADSTKVFECCAMLGMVTMETSKYDDAIKYFEKIFTEVTVPPEQVADLRYELATAYHESGLNDKALKNFNIIHEIDHEFRDVAEKIKIITSAEKEQGPTKISAKKSKISYV